jgi:hypothetical protein
MSAAKVIHGQGLLPALQRAGFLLPDDCRWVEIHAGVDEAMTIRFDIHVKREQLPMLAKAFTDLAREYVDFDAAERPGAELPDHVGNGENFPAEPPVSETLPTEKL